MNPDHAFTQLCYLQKHKQNPHWTWFHMALVFVLVSFSLWWSWALSLLVLTSILLDFFLSSSCSLPQLVLVPISSNSWSFQVLVFVFLVKGFCLTWSLSFLSFFFLSSLLLAQLRPSCFEMDTWFICLTWDSRNLGICHREQEGMSLKIRGTKTADVPCNSQSKVYPGVWSSAESVGLRPLPPPAHLVV